MADIIDLIKGVLEEQDATAKAIASKTGRLRQEVNKALYARPDLFMSQGADKGGPKWMLRKGLEVEIVENGVDMQTLEIRVPAGDVRFNDLLKFAREKGDDHQVKLVVRIW